MSVRVRGNDTEKLSRIVWYIQNIIKIIPFKKKPKESIGGKSIPKKLEEITVWIWGYKDFSPSNHEDEWGINHNLPLAVYVWEFLPDPESRAQRMATIKVMLKGLRSLEQETSGHSC